MLQIVNSIGDLLFEFLPVPETDRLLIMKQLHNDIALRILIEYHLKISRHRQKLVHRHALRINLHQIHQPEKV